MMFIAKRTCARYFTICALGLTMLPAIAGTRPQVDLSVSVTTAPVPFVPGGIGTVTMTVHNAGPEAAGAVIPNERWIIVYERPYDITTQPPPFVLFEPAQGCSAYAEETEPFPDGHVSFLFSYWFDAIPAGQSRTCIYRLQFDPSLRESFATYWFVASGNDDDINPSNNRFDYTFIAPAGPSASVPVAATSLVSQLLLGIGVLLTVLLARRRAF